MSADPLGIKYESNSYCFVGSNNLLATVGALIPFSFVFIKKQSKSAKIIEWFGIIFAKC